MPRTDVVQAVAVEPDDGPLLAAFIDLPTPGPAPAGDELDVIGWAVGRDCPVVGVEVWADDRLVRRAPAGLPRWDLAGVFADRPYASRGGFRVAVPVPLAGERDYRLRAVFEVGDPAPLGAVRVRVTDEPLPPTPPADPLDVVGRHWSATSANPPPNWLDPPLVRAHVNRLISGDGQTDWLTYVARKFLIRDGRGVDRVLSLGCGTGSIERQLRSLGACAAADGLDVAEGSLAEARRRADAEGISGLDYRVADLNRVNLPPAAYDAVVASMSVHHVAALEDLFAQVRRTLRPGGLFALCEFVGPTQFQWGPKATRVVNELLALLPARLRRESVQPAVERTAFEAPTLAVMNAVDPSESVRSADILPLLEREFTVVERRDFGGTVAHLLLGGLAHNFRPDSPDDDAILNLILYLEGVLIREGVLTSDFTLVVAAPRADGGVGHAEGG